MNKTITINLAGIVFHIEEAAYEILRAYMLSVKARFRLTEGAEEIMADIEARVAEMFQAKLDGTKQVVNQDDVKEVIRIMGNPEEFDSEPSKEEEPQNWDIPLRPQKRRLFRNPDDKILGGVCSGIAAYLDIDPVWIRLGFVAFFFVGAGVLCYLVLWIIVPQARTTAEKLQMRGEPVNIDNIERTIRQEMESVKQRFNTFKSNAKNWKKDDYMHGVRSFSGRILDLFGQIAKVFFEVIYKIAAVMLVIVGFLVLWVLLSIALGWTHFLSGDLNQLSVTLFSSSVQRTMALVSLLLFVGVPFFLLLFKGVRMLFGISINHRIFKVVGFSLWLIGLLGLCIVGKQLSSEFRHHTKVRKEIPTFQPVGNTVYVECVDTLGNTNIHINGIPFKGTITTNDITLGSVRLSIVRSENDKFQVEEVFSGYGINNFIAEKNTEDIRYSFSQKDSVFRFNDYFSLGEHAKYRGQQVRLILKVPEGKAVFLRDGTTSVLSDVRNVNGLYDEEMEEHKWLMTAQGLKCMDCDEWERYDYKRSERHRHHHDSDDGDNESGE